MTSRCSWISIACSTIARCGNASAKSSRRPYWGQTCTDHASARRDRGAVTKSWRTCSNRRSTRSGGMIGHISAIGLSLWLSAASVACAWAQAEAFAGKTVHLIIGFGPGGGYDMWGRTVARHIGKHLPGKPNVVPQNMPGAGSFVATSHVYNVAPRDGTVLAIVARDAPLGPLSGAAGA